MPTYSLDKSNCGGVGSVRWREKGDAAAQATVAPRNFQARRCDERLEHLTAWVGGNAIVGGMGIAPITLKVFEQLRPPTTDDHFWFRHYAQAWFATDDRLTIAVVYRAIGDTTSYIVLGRNDDGSYTCASTGAGMTSVEHAAKVINATIERDA